MPSTTTATAASTSSATTTTSSASTANYMHHLGWRPNEPWLEEVRVTGELPWQEADLAIKHPLSKWAGWGITRMRRQPAADQQQPHCVAAAPHGAQRAGLPRLSQLRHLYGVEQLAHLRDDGRLSRHAHRRRVADEPRARADLRPRSARRRRSCSGSLPAAATTSARSTVSRGRRRATAVKDMQLKLGLPADSYPTPELLAALRGGALSQVLSAA